RRSWRGGSWTAPPGCSIRTTSRTTPSTDPCPPFSGGVMIRRSMIGVWAFVMVAAGAVAGCDGAGPAFYLGRGAEKGQKQRALVEPVCPADSRPARPAACYVRRQRRGGPAGQAPLPGHLAGFPVPATPPPQAGTAPESTAARFAAEDELARQAGSDIAMLFF